MKSYFTILIVVSIVLIFSLQGCANLSHDNRFDTVQNAVKQLLDREAKRTVVKLFDAKYDTYKSKLVYATQINHWVKNNKIDIKKYPSEIQKAIKDKSAIGLYVTEFIPIEPTKSKNKLYANGGIFLPIWTAPEGIGGWWIIPAGPCDGDMCRNCAGCEGYNCLTGLFETCVCTYSCKRCNECPSCPTNCQDQAPRSAIEK